RAESLEEPVGNVRVRLVDLIDQHNATVLWIGCGIERRHGRPAESSLLQSALPVKRPPEGAGPEESADGQALLELLDHVSPILTDVARVVVLPSVLGIDDWLERRRD